MSFENRDWGENMEKGLVSHKISVKLNGSGLPKHVLRPAAELSQKSKYGCVSRRLFSRVGK